MTRMGMLFELFVATMALNLETLISKTFVVIWVSNIKSLLLVRWLGRCSTSIGLRGDIGLRQ
jgi:hypothetical protein